MDISRNTLTTTMIISFVFIITAFIFLFFRDLRKYGIIILGSYSIFLLIGIAYFGQQYFGLGIPVMVLIFLLSVFLMIILSLEQRQVCKDKERDDINICSVKEHFGTPTGPVVDKHDKWGVRLNSSTVESDGTLNRNGLSKMKKQLSYYQETCGKQIEDLKRKIQAKEISTGYGLTPGPCITAEGKWGVIIPRFGRKCVPGELIIPKKDGEDKKKDDGDGDGDGDGDKDKKQKQLFNKLVANIFVDPKYKATKCGPDGTKNEKKFAQECGDGYLVKDIKKCANIKCPDPSKFKTEKECRDFVNKYKNYRYAVCEPIESCKDDLKKKYGKLTDPKQLDEDFDYWCSDKYGENYGVKEILKGKDACLRDEKMGIGVCSDRYYDEINYEKRTTPCMPKYDRNGENYKNKFLNECKKLYPDTIEVRNIAGYNCDPGYYRGQCFNQNMINFYKNLKKKST